MLGAGCSSAPKAPLPKKYQDRARDGGGLTKQISPQERQAFEEIRAMYQKGATDGALVRATEFHKKFKNSSLQGLVWNYAGLSMLAKKEFPAAIQHFEKALKLSPDVTYDQYVQYNLATAFFESKRTKDARALLESVRPALLNAATQLKYYFLRGSTYRRLELPAEAVRDFVEAATRAQDRTPIAQEAELALGAIKDPALLASLHNENEGKPLADFIIYRAAVAALSAGKTGIAEEYFKTVLLKYPQSPRYPDSVSQLRSLQSNTTADAQSVGVLVPMTGKFAKFGLQTLQGVALAFRIYNADEPASKLSLVIEDSGETAESAVAALERLYYEHRAIAVIGPLLSKGVEAAAERARDLGIAMLYLSQNAANPNGFAFHFAVNTQIQVNAVARFALERKKLKRFVILYPEDKTGREFASLFWDKVEAAGGEVVGFEGYPPGETDFRQPIERVTGLAYPDARARELDALARYREEYSITRRTRKTESYFRLEPIVDFDAVYIPDEAKVVSQVLPTFAYLEAENIQFLGNSMWNSETLLQRSKNYVEDAVFVDVFNKDSPSKETQLFLTRFQKTFGENPNAVNALAFDAANMLENALLQSAGTPNRAETRDLLLNVRDFPGVTGRMSILENQIVRQLKLLTVERGKIVEIPG